MASAPDPADAIAAALSRLRGRGIPRPPWGAGPGPHRHGAGDAGWHGGPHPHHTHGDHADHGGHGGHGDHPDHGGRGGPFGGPGSWGPGPGQRGQGARFGGPARLRLLEALAAASDPLTVSEIGDAIGVDQPRASRLVQQSVELGLVTREADPDDARRTRIALTDQGRSIVRGFRGERRDAIDSALTAFTDAERSELARLLTKLAEAWPRT